LRNKQATDESRKQKEFDMIGELKRFLKEEAGPTAVEYAIMLALVALAIALATPNIRSAVLSVFNATSTAISGL